MKKGLILAAILAVVSVGAAVAQPRAIGVNLGYNIGISYQHSFGENNFLDVAVDIPQLNGIGGIVTYNWLNPFGTAVPWEYKGAWNWYLGVGATGGFYGLFDNTKVNGAYVGVAGQVGIAYDFWFPLQLSLDYRPNIGLHFGDKVSFNQHGFYGITLGVRYLF